jgi:glycosyltransferase involved in cell wall biosynthesis
MGRRSPTDGLNVLFVGQVCLRKGVPYLLEAMRLLNSSKLRCRVVGALALDRKRVVEYSRWVEFVGHASSDRLSDLYHWADVFAFPSLYEGFALVQLEAMACGVPVITTPNAAPVVRDGMEGFIIPIRDVEALAARLDRLLLDRDLLSAMSQRALERVSEFTLDRYGERLVDAVESSLACKVT